MATVTETTSYGFTGGTGRNAFFNFMKLDYLPELNAHLHIGTSLPEYVAKSKGKMGGQKSISVAATSFPPAGVGRFEGHKLPTPRSTGSINPEMFARTMMYRLRWTMEVMASVRKGGTSWRSPMQTDMEMAREQFTQTFGRKCGAGWFDVLGVIQSASTTTLTMYGRNTRTSGSPGFYKTGVHYLKPNQSIQIVPTARGFGGHSWAHTKASAGELLISSVDDSSLTAPTITVDADPSGASYLNTAVGDGDFVIAYAERLDDTGSNFPSSSSPSTALNSISNYQGLNGLDAVCTDETNGPHSALFGYAKSTNPGLKAFSAANGGTPRQYTERYIEIVVRRCAERSGDKPKVALMHPSLVSEHAKENRGDRMFSEVITKSGYGKLSFTMGSTMIPIEEDWLVKPGIAYLFDPAHFGWYEQRGLASVDEDFEYRFVADYAASEIAAAKMGNIEHTRPFAAGSADDFIYDVNDIT